MDRIIELGLSRRRKSDKEDTVVDIVHLLERLLSLIVDSTAEGEDPAFSTLRSRMDQTREKIVRITGREIQSQIAGESLELCQQLFRQSQIRRLERDEKFAEVIDLLRDALASFAGHSKAFNTSLIGSSNRLIQLAEIGEIHELRKKITGELKELKRVVSEKQQQEEHQYSQMTQRVSVLQKRLEQAKTEASLDGLMRIANRRSFDLALQRWITEHEKSEGPFTLALLDLDDFKKVNDTHGHQVGDEVLVFVAQYFSGSIRGGDFLARYGGEEIVILFRGMRLQTAETRIPEFLGGIANSRIQCKRSDGTSLHISVTASCGAAEYALGEKPEDLLRRADEALYEAKRQGKNRIVTKRRPLLSAFYEGRKRAHQPETTVETSKI